MGPASIAVPGHLPVEVPWTVRHFATASVR